MAPLQVVERPCSLPSLNGLAEALILHDWVPPDHDSLGLVPSVSMNLLQ
jgi:hypothetical protein